MPEGRRLRIGLAAGMLALWVGAPAMASGLDLLSPEDRALIDGVLGGPPAAAGSGPAPPGPGDAGLAAARRTLESTLETGRPGVAERWEDAASGDFGFVVPEFDYRTDEGAVCRDYLRTLVRGTLRLGFSGTACRTGPGMWEVVGEALVDDPAASAPEPAAAPGEVPGTVVDLREVQSLLAAQGFDPGPVDGVAGSRTEGAIRAFQEEDGLAVDGRASARLLERLRLARIARQMALVRSDPEAFPPFAVSRPAPPLDPW